MAKSKKNKKKAAVANSNNSSKKGFQPTKVTKNQVRKTQGRGR